MEILEIIDELEDKIEESATIPFWGKGIVDKDELLDLLQEIRVKFPDEMKQAKWVKEERQRIINDAQKEAANIIKSAEDKIVSMINEHEITKQAFEQANQIIEKAQNNSHEIRLGANQYADDILRNLEEQLVSTAEMLRSNRQELKN